ncbi:cytochrome P450 [Aspergillus japonicus CBS 114.51]|uniref:Cytochrome P450 n=1 Tax=Aspergillus japonicus CBS 114.51 TaxID=1448312 RepID=A0A8T8WZ87_ASPJA|nr:cytochrome P450 [Aspergillus japonicus CBS 114.51]RAH80712.1 cytochrome P450 [Aspergillus japonicus CBS 114.51]
MLAGCSSTTAPLLDKREDTLNRFVRSSLLLSYVVCVGIYRLYFSPNAKFPGPKLAALTGLYEAYFDLIPKGGGQFPFEIKRMHAKYGPIVRIDPEEMHIDDPEFYETLYPTSKPYDQLQRLENRFGIPGATFSTARHDVHKIRRAAISPFFAKAKVREQTGHATVFTRCWPPACPPEELTYKRMQHESESLIGAGLETTAWTLALGTRLPQPERWLHDPRGPDGLHPLTHYLTVFGRGTRMCLGLNLAYAELYIGFATLIRRHRLRLVGTTVRDVAFYAENTILSPWTGTKGVRVLVESSGD